MRAVAGIVTMMCVLAVSTIFVAVDAPAQGTWVDRVPLEKGGTPPTTANPYLAFLATDTGDYEGWNSFAESASPARIRAQGQPPRGPRSDQVAERPGNNDRPQQAQRLFLDTRRGNGSASIDVIGRGAPQPPGTTTDLGALVEPNDSYGDATTVPPLGVGDIVTGSGEIAGDAENPFDFDVLELVLTAGTQLVVDIDTTAAPGLDSYLTLWDGVTPFPIAENDDNGASSDSRLQYDVPADGTYYVIVAGFGAFGPLDPNDPNSPSVTGAPGSVGEYAFSVEARSVESDWYKVRLRAGDVFGAALFDGAGRVELYGPNGDLLIGSGQDLTFIHPVESPLPGGGNAASSYVISEAGEHRIRVDTSGDYLAQFRGFRPLGDADGRQTQVLYLDFDGATIDPGIFQGGPFGFEVPLSPLSSFLGAWGLTPADEDAVIDAIIAEVVENVDSDLEAVGLNSSFDIEVRNSRDDADPWGQPLVSRIVIGGTIPELGIGTVGIAQSIDVGNFDAEESAVVLLDLLSGTGPFPAPPVDLNTYELAPGTTIVDLIGRGVGAIAAHEAGHFFANWHTDQFNPHPNVMDQGGNIPFTILGIGPDGIFGSADDVDVDFIADTYVPGEGFVGTEDTRNAIAWGLWSTPG